MVRSWQRPTESIIEPDPLTTTQEVALELNTDYSVVVQHLKQTGKVEKLCKWAPHELTENQKDVILKCRILLFNMTIMKHFPNKLLCAMKTGLYMTTRDDQLSGRMRRSSKALPKVRLTPKKVTVTVWWSSGSLIHYSFLNPSRTITSEKYAQQIDEMYWKWQRLQPALVNRKASVLHNNPDHTSHNQCFKR